MHNRSRKDIIFLSDYYCEKASGNSAYFIFQKLHNLQHNTQIYFDAVTAVCLPQIRIVSTIDLIFWIQSNKHLHQVDIIGIADFLSLSPPHVHI